MNKKESLAAKILRYIKENKKFSMQELYREFGEYKPHSVRARVYESKPYREKKLIKTERGTYVLVGADIEAAVECVDTKKHIYKLVDAKLTYDLVFLDIPYSVGGIKGGNRKLVDYDLISPEEFKDIIVQAEKLLKDEDSQLYFMIAGGKSSIKDSMKYIRMFEHTNLKLNNEGSYTKLTSSGKVCNMGKYPMPPEIILSFSLSGKERADTEKDGDMHYRFKRPSLPKSGGYRTEKPIGLMEALIKRATKVGEKVLDLFSGSGVTAEAALNLGRKIHCLEISENAIEKHIIPRIRRFCSGIVFPDTAQPAVQTAGRRQTSIYDFI